MNKSGQQFSTTFQTNIIMSPTPALKEEQEDGLGLVSSPAPSATDIGTPEPARAKSDSAGDSDKKRQKTSTKSGGGAKKPSDEVLQRRREGRLKAAATIAQNLKKTGIGRFEEQNGFALTSVKTIPLINQKNYFADYLKKDDQISVMRNWKNERSKEPVPKSAGSESKKAMDDDDDEDDDDDNDDASPGNVRMGEDTIVIHPGSQWLRIGRGTDSFPTSVPMVVAVPNSHKFDEYPLLPRREEYDDGSVDFGEAFDAAKALVTKDFKARMRFYKRRMMPNSRESAANFNKNQKPEVVPDNSDPDYKEFYDPADPELKCKSFLAGHDALKVPLSEDYTEWRLRFPIVNGTFNKSADDYGSQQEFLADLSRIVEEALKAINVSLSDASKLKCLLIIPDLYSKEVVEAWVNLLLKTIGFSHASILQEAVAATFGSGISCACVVDVGAQKTSISCVDEGMVINDSRVLLHYGGDNITETLTKLLLQQRFPVQDINLQNRNDDWEFADRLKRNFATFDDADIAVQLYNFHIRRAGGETYKYQFKVYDEVMLAPLGLFHPKLFELSEEVAASNELFPESYDHYTGEYNNPYSKAQDNLQNDAGFTELTDEQLILKIIEDKQIFKQANAAYAKPLPNRTSSEDDSRKRPTYPLDKAIIESITNAGIATDFNRAKKMYDNVIVVGGGLAKFPGFDVLLNDRINIWRPKFLSTSNLDDILSYVGKEKEQLDAKRKQMIADATAKKKESQKEEDAELAEEELQRIEEETTLTVDLAQADAVADQGSIIPVNVLPAPKEFDPQMITWKGGSVYSRLKVINEMWIAKEDWESLNSRCLYYKSLFNY